MNRATGIIVGVLTVLVAWFVWQAQRNASELRTRLLTSDARVELLTNDADAALPLALAAAHNDFSDSTVQAMLNDVVSAASRHVLHTNAVDAVAFSPDGNYVLSGGGDPRLWDVATGEIVQQFRGHRRTIMDVAFSPDGAFVLSGSQDTTIRLWDVATGEEVRVFRGHEHTVNSIAFSPDGEYILSGACSRRQEHTCLAGELRLWEVATGESVRVFTGHTDQVQSVAFSPDGQYALSGSCANSNERLCEAGELRLWDVATGDTLRVFEGHESGVYSVAFSPDGQMVLSGSADYTLRLWDVATGDTLRIFRGHASVVDGVAFSPDGQYILSGSWDETVRLWETDTGTPARIFSGHTFYIADVAFSPDGQHAVSGARDDTARLWDVTAWDGADDFATAREWICANRHVEALTDAQHERYNLLPWNRQICPEQP